MAAAAADPIEGAAGGPASIVLLGHGAIGQDLLRLLAPEIGRGELVVRAAIVRDPSEHDDAEVPIVTADEAAEAIDGCDLLVECAGVAAVRELADGLAPSCRALLLTSVGALAEAPVRDALLRVPGLIVTNGAIGGFDVLAAAAGADGLDEVTIRTRKLAGALQRPWMSADERARLAALRPGDAPLTVFAGDPAAAIERFPANVNVAVALAWATRGCPPAAPPAAQSAALERSLRRVRVELLADPDSRRSQHEIVASGPAGRFALSLESAPSPSNPRTSALTAMSLAKDVRAWLARR